MYLATLQNIRTKTDAWRLVLFIAFSSFQHLPAVPYKKSKEDAEDEEEEEEEDCIKNNNKTHESEPLV
jgi:hypothetical protein